MKNADKPACPVTNSDSTYERIANHGGLTKREMFAMAAMQGLLSGHSEYFHGNAPVMVPSEVAKYSVMYADELLKQLESSKPE